MKRIVRLRSHGQIPIVPHCAPSLLPSIPAARAEGNLSTPDFRPRRSPHASRPRVQRSVCRSLSSSRASAPTAAAAAASAATARKSFFIVHPSCVALIFFMSTSWSGNTSGSSASGPSPPLPPNVFPLSIMSQKYGKFMGILCAVCEFSFCPPFPPLFTKSLHNFNADPIAFPPARCYTVSRFHRKEERLMNWNVYEPAADLDDLIFDENRRVPSER